MNNRTTERQHIADVLEHAPSVPPVPAPADLSGVTTPTGLFVCSTCSGRYVGRGGNAAGWLPVWNDAPSQVATSCEFCTGANEKAVA